MKRNWVTHYFISFIDDNIFHLFFPPTCLDEQLRAHEARHESWDLVSSISQHMGVITITMMIYGRNDAGA